MSVFSPLAKDIVDFGTKNSNERKDPVSKITIHHMAGVSTGKNCATAHRNGTAASANYYVGNAGDICGGVSEDRRAWTSGTGNGKGTNDHMAITIECSNSATGDPWPVSDAAYRATIALCADICKRYGIAPKYTGDQNGTLTLHCMFQATACPGPTWKGYFANGKVEKDIIAAMSQQKPQSGTAASEDKIWNFLSNHIGNDYGAAGMMGNMSEESGLKTNNLQNSFEKKLGMTDEQYTAAIDSGAYTRDQFISDGAGMGLCQWTAKNRKAGLYDMKSERGCSIADLDLQLAYIWKELREGYRGVLNGLKASKSVYEASTIVLTQFEKPLDQGEAVKQRRAATSQMYYDRYAKKDGPAGYIVRITADELNVRSGPGTNFDIVQTVHQGEAFTIVQVVNDWGKLKSGVGWICLTYTEKV